jgi:xylan 1,4-beta-xylosidase
LSEAAWAKAPLPPLPIETVDVDLTTEEGALAHIWSECVGSDRAGLTMREEWRLDAKRAYKEAGIKRVRFHGIFNDDEMAVRPKGAIGAAGQSFNFQNVDTVYDGVLETGMKPFVELSFMPSKLASGTANFGTYRGNITPPASLDDWKAFVALFVRHLVDRYGAAEVRQWYFEVWNEPDLGFFWSGTQQQYFELYKATAVTLKSIDKDLQVGGPATSGSHWLPEFTGWCAQNNAPVDFISTHMYAGGDPAKTFCPGTKLQVADVIPEAVRRARQQIDSSPFAGRPLWLTEWSSDSPAMIAHIAAACLPHCQAMSQWVLSSTYEELGVSDYLLRENDTSWGTIVQGVARPSFNTYKLLHRLGPARLQASGPVLASKRANGQVAVLVWNLADVKQSNGLPWQNYERAVVGEPKRLEIEFAGARPGRRVRVSYVDQERGSPLPAWRKLGSPQYIKPADLEMLRRSAEIPPPQMLRLDDRSRLRLDLPPEGVALVELG